jgi:protein-tyrosine phosphatase
MNRDDKMKFLYQISHITDNIYLSCFEGARNDELIKNNNIKAIVRIIEPVFLSQLPEKSDIFYHYIPITDHPGELINSYINNFLKFMETNKDKNILIHCMMGISRSATFTILYLMNQYKWNLDKTLKFVKSKRPFC